MKVTLDIDGSFEEVVRFIKLFSIGEEPVTGISVAASEEKIVYDATAIVICMKDGKVYLSKRLETCATYKNHYCVVGGKLTPEEEKTPLVGAMRELFEEGGLELQDSRFELMEVSEKEPTSKIEYVYRTWLRPGEILKNTEPHKHTDWVLYPLEAALKLPLIPKLKPLFEKMLNEQSK